MWISKKDYVDMEHRLAVLEYEKAQIRHKMLKGVLVRVWNLCEDFEQNPVIVSFVMTDGDWCKLEKSALWSQVEEQILRSQREHSQTSLQSFVNSPADPDYRLDRAVSNHLL